MKKGPIILLLFAVTVTSALVIGNLAWSKITFLSPAFAKELCKQWNNIGLARRLGTSAVGGNNWVTTGGKSYQNIAVFARNCRNPKVQLSIYNRNGYALCVYGGSLVNNPDWQFGPTTYEWQKWANQWSAMNMPALMSTFRGNIVVAKQNLANFGLFWKAAARAVNATGSGYGCD